MYCSVLPLLLLFASTICASPVHIGRRFNLGDVQLPHDKIMPNAVYSRYSESIKGSFEGVQGALMIKTIAMKVEVGGVGAKPMMDMIKNLELANQLPYWGWTLTRMIPINRVTFILEMVPEAEATVKKYWEEHGMAGKLN